MASKTYIQHYSDGTHQVVRRSAKQGRKVLPKDLLKVPITIWVERRTKANIAEKAKQIGFSMSKYGEIAIILFDINQFSASGNCSIQ